MDGTRRLKVLSGLRKRERENGHLLGGNWLGIRLSCSSSKVYHHHHHSVLLHDLICLFSSLQAVVSSCFLCVCYAILHTVHVVAWTWYVGWTEKYHYSTYTVYKKCQINTFSLGNLFNLLDWTAPHRTVRERKKISTTLSNKSNLDNSFFPSSLPWRCPLETVVCTCSTMSKVDCISVQFRGNNRFRAMEKERGREREGRV